MDHWVTDPTISPSQLPYHWTSFHESFLEMCRNLAEIRRQMAQVSAKMERQSEVNGCKWATVHWCVWVMGVYGLSMFIAMHPFFSIRRMV